MCIPLTSHYMNKIEQFLACQFHSYWFSRKSVSQTPSSPVDSCQSLIVSRWREITMCIPTHSVFHQPTSDQKLKYHALSNWPCPTCLANVWLQVWFSIKLQNCTVPKNQGIMQIVGISCVQDFIHQCGSVRGTQWATNITC